MGWIKRNLFFVIGGVVALALLGWSGFYIYQSWSHNSEASSKLAELYNTLGTLGKKSPSFGNDTINNTDIARDQNKQVEAWINSAHAYFQPIAPIPADSTSSEAYASALSLTLADLRKQAEHDGIGLPPNYNFSFSAQGSIMQFAPGSIPLLAVQLGEVKALTQIAFDSGINSLDGIQRVRVSDDDAKGPASDYTSKQPTTNDLAIVTPYVITFRSFTPELAKLIAAFASSSNGFIIKSINVQPADMVTAGQPGEPNMQGGPGGYPPGGYQPGGYPPRYGGYPQGGYPPGYLPPGAMAPGRQPVVSSKGGLQTVLKEELLRITIEVDLVKLLPKT